MTRVKDSEEMLEHANQLHQEWVQMDSDIYMLELDAENGTDFERKTASILRQLYRWLETKELGA